MQDQNDQPQPQFPVPPATSAAAAQTDPLAQATEAVEACIARTAGNPSARMQEIAKIRAAYIKTKFGVDIN